MVADARLIPAGKSFDADICIVGGGVAGMVLARELSGRQARVILLESGGWEPNCEAQALYAGENVGLPYFPLDDARARYFGGSSHKWHIPIGGDRIGLRLRPLDAIDFEERDWVPHSGWPFAKSHLDPFYDRAQKICRVQPVSFDPQDWDDPKARPQLPFQSADVETIIYKFGQREVFSEELRREVANADNITTYLNANVLEFETRDNALEVTRLRVASLAGNEFSLSARVYVLANGGIEAPRLLLLSNKIQKSGLGNQHDLVGRFFMEHLHFWSGAFFPASAEMPQRMSLYSDVHRVSDVPIVGKLALSEKALRREKLLNQNVQLFPQIMADPEKYPVVDAPAVASFKTLCSELAAMRKPVDFRRHFRNVTADVGSVTTVGWRKFARKMGLIPEKFGYVLANMTEQIPNPNSRVTLGSQRDALGQNRVRLDWRVTTQDIDSAVRTHAILKKAFDAAGHGHIARQLHDATPPGDLHGGYHHMGTTRMHNDPKKGVVDSNSRVHGISNLYIAGPSVFPTGGYANPVLTVVALTIRLAEHIKAVLN